MFKKDNFYLGIVFTTLLFALGLLVTYIVSINMADVFLRKHYILSFIPPVLLLWYYMRKKITHAGKGGIAALFVLGITFFIFYFYNIF